MSSSVEISGKYGISPTVCGMVAKGPPGLRDLLAEVKRKLGTKRAVANAIGVSEGRIGRVMLGQGSMELPNLLRLAELADAAPSDVLRAGGKGADADLIEKVYGVGRAPLSSSQRELLEIWEQLPDSGRNHLRALMREVIGATATAPVLTMPGKASTPKTRRRLG